MKIAHITTTNSTKEISKFGEIDFCLAPFYKRNKEYREYFHDAVKKGRHVILDNGIAENDLIKDDELVDIAIKLKVTELVIPDTIGDYQKTKDMRESFLEKYYYKLNKNNINLMSVIQGKTYDEYITNYNELQVNKFISTIGIPFRMDYSWFNDSQNKTHNHALNRILFVKSLYITKPIHCLGCNSLFEMNLLFHQDVRSVDSKLIARYALNNKKINIDDNEKPTKKLYLKDELNKKQIKKCINDIQKIKEEIKDGC